MLLYNTLSQSKKELRPLANKRVNLFVCGPTVYDHAHIGHARTYISFDAFAKYLKLQNFTVSYIQNITDLDDKIIDRAKETNQTPLKLAQRFEDEYHKDMQALGVDAVNKYSRATNYIPQIISQIERLMAKDFAYAIEDDGVYFDITKFANYGKLSHRTAQQADDAVSRIDKSIKKRNKGDFAIWKFSRDGEPKWPSPWGDGRPGWHIEDTAITETELGAQYDIHGGARDLIFPHHESEIALMESISGKEPLVNYWMHTGFLTVNGEKMSKSLRNFVTIQDFLKKYTKETFRLFVLSSHYRSPIDYSETAVKQAEVNASRLGEFYSKIASLANSLDVETVASDQITPIDYRKLFDEFHHELNDDFNTPKAFAVIFELVRQGNSGIARNEMSATCAKALTHFLDEINQVFGIIPKDVRSFIPSDISKMAKTRQEMRQHKKWGEADKLRRQIEEKGYILKDTADGFEIKKA